MNGTTPLPAVTISRELFDFLMGAGEIDGTSFGELNEGLPGAFWWRALLRAAERESGERESSSERELLLTQACALYDDALDMMFDGPDESDEGYAKARWREARELLRKYLASTTREPAQGEAK